MLIDREGDYEIMSNRHVVWINDPERCVGRLCEYFVELFLTNLRVAPDFDLFASEINHHYGITVAEHHRPQWAKKAPS
jgi:hypothetical protein